jgi:hypothetical protein
MGSPQRCGERQPRQTRTLDIASRHDRRSSDASDFLCRALNLIRSRGDGIDTISTRDKEIRIVQLT